MTTKNSPEKKSLSLEQLSYVFIMLSGFAGLIGCITSFFTVFFAIAALLLLAAIVAFARFRVMLRREMDVLRKRLEELDRKKDVY